MSKQEIEKIRECIKGLQLNMDLTEKITDIFGQADENENTGSTEVFIREPERFAIDCLTKELKKAETEDPREKTFREAFSEEKEKWKAGNAREKELLRMYYEIVEAYESIRGCPEIVYDAMEFTEARFLNLVKQERLARKAEEKGDRDSLENAVLEAVYGISLLLTETYPKRKAEEYIRPLAKYVFRGHASRDFMEFFIDLSDMEKRKIASVLADGEKTEEEIMLKVSEVVFSVRFYKEKEGRNVNG